MDIDLSQLTDEQIKALNLTDEQIKVINGSIEPIPGLGGAIGYLAFKKINGKMTLFMLDGGSWRGIDYNELVNIASK